jgi:hypothetical protein
MSCVEFGSTCFTAGDTITMDWSYTTDEGVPVDLTGATAQMQLLEAITDVNQFIDMTGGITDAVNGTGRFSLTKVQSQTLLPIIEGGQASKKYTSKIRFTYSDSTTASIAGINVDIEQSGIR